MRRLISVHECVFFLSPLEGSPLSASAPCGSAVYLLHNQGVSVFFCPFYVRSSAAALIGRRLRALPESSRR